ncbi:hypothetical protein LTS14_005863 [Recurvomyces mirabilis]|uniref:uncharacterized protein n=1 Tax=Recurvomyces mirabilis TaxID=574656 RepID=UPI002DE1720A|nr:hypothetical protein LTS14_005863 [Recurvomyces mirabilis]
MAPSRGLRRLTDPARSSLEYYVCPRCRLQARSFSTTPSIYSGHNRWSKIKHDKAKVDSVKNKQRSIFSAELATASKLFGPDPSLNTRLADLITKAKREGFAKASIEAAIARGQGRSTSGVALESVTLEGILPGNVAVIVECETDNKLRTLAEVRLILKEAGGNATPYAALEAGATDVEEDEEGRVVVLSEPGETKAVGEAVAQSLGLQIATSSILWDPNGDTKVAVQDEKAAQELGEFVDELQDRETSLQAVSMNVARGSLDDVLWKEVQTRLSS